MAAANSPVTGPTADTSSRPTPQQSGRLIPAVTRSLATWQYLEYSLLRILAGWGRCAGPWEDKLAVCYHVWLQAEIVGRLRKRLEQFPPHKPEGPVGHPYQVFCEAVLLAPDWHEAVAGAYGVFNPALADTYARYLAESHPVHDLPTHEMLREILALKRVQSEWYAGFLARHPDIEQSTHVRDARRGLRDLGDIGLPPAPTAPYAAPCGRGVEFRMPVEPGRVPDWDLAPNILPLLEADWTTSVEARRLFFMIGYFWEMGVAENQMRWLYYADFMPWEFIHAEARHLWDESRHGDSGLSRLRDFGLDIKDIGYSSYGASGAGSLPPMTPRDLYEDFYAITQIAERGYFKTKSYCLEDFAAGGDAASAEMMQFDIIDETSHAEYGRQWLSVLAREAGVEEDWLRRGAADREAAQKKSEARAASLRRSLADGGAGEGLPTLDARAHYAHLLAVLRERCPLSNADTAPVRPDLPM